MNVLIVYATYSGGTEQGAQIIAEVLKEKKYSVNVKRADAASADEFKNYDLVVLGSPSWLDLDYKNGRPHQYMIELMEKAVEVKTLGTKYAVFGMGDTNYAWFCGAVDYLQGFVKQLGGQLVTESLRIDGFYFDEERNREKVAIWAKKLH